MAQRKKRDVSIVDAMKKQDKEVHPVGELMSNNQHVYKVRVLKNFHKSGVPLNKIDDFRELLEEGGYCLTSAPNIWQLVPYVKVNDITDAVEALQQYSYQHKLTNLSHLKTQQNCVSIYSLVWTSTELNLMTETTQFTREFS